MNSGAVRPCRPFSWLLQKRRASKSVCLGWPLSYKSFVPSNAHGRPDVQLLCPRKESTYTCEINTKRGRCVTLTGQSARRQWRVVGLLWSFYIFFSWFRCRINIFIFLWKPITYINHIFIISSFIIMALDRSKVNS